MTWYEDDVKGAIAERERLHYEPKTIFYGSSTIRLWDTLYDDFDQYHPVNLGFGGSTLAACGWFFNDIVAPIHGAKRLILYAGDNDLGDGRNPEEVCIFYRYFLSKFRKAFPVMPLYFISVKPSIQREDIMEKIEQANTLIRDEIDNGSGKEFYVNWFKKMITKNRKPNRKLFDEDGLHLNADGYNILKEVVLEHCFDR